MDPLVAFKLAQKVGWDSFGPQEIISMIPAPRLADFARVEAGQHLLDVACGTGVVAITSRRLGAKVVGIDFAAKLLERAAYNAQLSELEVDWVVGDVENLPFADRSFDTVVSQFGHIFAPRPALALSEMLRVLRPGGTIAFSAWPPESLAGRTFFVTSRYMPPPPPGVAPPIQWGDQPIVRERFGDAVKEVVFSTEMVLSPVLSPQHFRIMLEQTAGPLVRLVDMLQKSNPSKLAEFRSEFDAISSEYFRNNTVRQDYLIVRAIKNLEQPSDGL